MSNYVWFHMHSDISNGITNIDSITKFKSYVDLAQKYGMKAMAFSEHGSAMEWYHKKEAIEKAGMLYIHGEEFYVTETLDEKIRDNYHLVLMARNRDGFKELNKLTSKSFNREDNSFYYVPRITIDDVLHTSDNIIVSTACLGGILNRGNDTIQERFVEFLARNRHRCFLEIQHHDVEDQEIYNQKLVKLSDEYNIPLIAGTDTHALNDLHLSGRKKLQEAKHVFFADEDKWDLTAKSYDELCLAYEKQNAIPEEYWMKAIENTNLLAEMVEPFEISTKYKYPKLYQDGLNVLKKKINEGYIERGIDKKPNKKEYLDRIRFEMQAIEHNDAADFFLLEEDYKRAMREKGIGYGYSRGSCSGSVICYLLHITDVDSVKYNLNYSRFMNPERVSLADIDTDWSPDERDEVAQYLFHKKGLYCSDIVTFNTIKLKGAFTDVARTYDIPLDQVRDVTHDIEEKEDEYRKKYPEIFQYVDLVKDVIVSIGNHPCAIIVSPVPLDEEVGLVSTSTDKYMISQLNMKEIDAQNFTKLDALRLENVGIINKTCDMVGIPRLTPDNIDFNDDKVWDSIRENTVGIFQMESNTAFQYIKKLFSDETMEKTKKYNPNVSKLDMMAIANGAIRPAGASYRDQLAEGVFKDNGNEALNKMMAKTNGFMVYQCQIIEFLHSFCGYTMGEADIVRRCVDEDTEITMWNGRTKRIKYINEGDLILSFKNELATIARVDGVFKNGKKICYTVHLEGDYNITCTKDHRLLTWYGWKKVSELSDLDYIFVRPAEDNSLDFDLRRVNWIETVGERNVYDIEVRDTHNYIANGIVVHNCFAKKTGTEAHLPRIRSGFIKTMKEKYGVSEEESEKVVEDFLKVIEDASDYLFSENHALPYSMIGYACGWLRYYYPLEFCTVYMNTYFDNEEKLNKIIDYMNKAKIKLEPPKFRHSIEDYVCNKEDNTIYKGLKSIKYVSTECAQELYDLRFMKFEDFTQLLVYMRENTSVNLRQVKVLVAINFFGEFGKNKKLMQVTERFYERYSKQHTDKTKEKRIKEIREYEQSLEDEILPIDEQIALEEEYLGYICVRLDIDKRYCYVLDVDSKYTPKIKLYSFLNGKLVECKADKREFAKHKIKKGSIIFCNKFAKRENWSKQGDEFVRNGTFSNVLCEWKEVDKDGLCGK